MTTESEKTQVKICGITTLEDARFVSGALADYIGFIFFPDSPRYVEPAKAGAIINWIEGPKKVGVFVNQPLDDVNNIARQTGVDLVQLHGTEPPEYCDLVDLPVIKVFHVTDQTRADELKTNLAQYEHSADYFLFDSKTETLWGGTGKTFNWNILKDISMKKPFFLSGGLNRENILSALETVKPAVIDLSSGLEKVPGIKDFDKVEEFFDEMRKFREKQEL